MYISILSLLSVDEKRDLIEKLTNSIRNTHKCKERGIATEDPFACYKVDCGDGMVG